MAEKGDLFQLEPCCADHAVRARRKRHAAVGSALSADTFSTSASKRSAPCQHKVQEAAHASALHTCMDAAARLRHLRHLCKMTRNPWMPAWDEKPPSTFVKYKLQMARNATCVAQRKGIRQAVVSACRDSCLHPMRPVAVAISTQLIFDFLYFYLMFEYYL